MTSSKRLLRSEASSLLGRIRTWEEFDRKTKHLQLLNAHLKMYMKSSIRKSQVKGPCLKYSKCRTPCTNPKREYNQYKQRHYLYICTHTYEEHIYLTAGVDCAFWKASCIPGIPAGRLAEPPLQIPFLQGGAWASLLNTPGLWEGNPPFWLGQGPSMDSWTSYWPLECRRA